MENLAPRFTWGLFINMFTIGVQTRFRASHSLILPNGSREPEHFHNWVVIADVSSEKLNDVGFVIDFNWLKAAVDKIIGDYKDVSLGSIEYFKKNNPSAENVAKYIYKGLKPRLPKDVKLSGITVFEQPGCSARYESRC
jgi:6-pyruvoyltetrahydropterin/6-carboxytetrahydropterin synthase